MTEETKTAESGGIPWFHSGDVDGFFGLSYLLVAAVMLWADRSPRGSAH